MYRIFSILFFYKEVDWLTPWLTGSAMMQSPYIHWPKRSIYRFSYSHFLLFCDLQVPFLYTIGFPCSFVVILFLFLSTCDWLIVSPLARPVCLCLSVLSGFNSSIHHCWRFFNTSFLRFLSYFFLVCFLFFQSHFHYSLEDRLIDVMHGERDERWRWRWKKEESGKKRSLENWYQSVLLWLFVVAR